MVVLPLCLLAPLLATLASVISLGMLLADWPNSWWLVIVARIITLIDSTALRLRHLPNGEDDEEQSPGRMGRAPITHNTHKIEA
jgi:hypothetical protein